uniref:Uncharacterized protein n=1 Tax=viral metagenome TaxID=1070528 RepID=A0A6H1ZWD3_9ZZZZ
MYPIQCYAGFAMPIKKGKFEIYGFSATVSDPTVDSRLVIVDDTTIADTDVLGKVLILADINSQKVILVNKKGIANVDPYLAEGFSEPIKTRNGTSVLARNLIGGSVCLYVR